MRNPESEETGKETFKELVLSVENPIMDKNYMVSFNAPDLKYCRNYNYAINKVLSAHGMRPFHQVGHHEESGYQAWEIWREVDRKDIESLLEEIQKEARKDFDTDQF